MRPVRCVRSAWVATAVALVAWPPAAVWADDPGYGQGPAVPPRSSDFDPAAVPPVVPASSYERFPSDGPDYVPEVGPLSSSYESLNRATRNVFDAIVVRPVFFGLLGMGAIGWLPSWPVAWLFGAGDDVNEALILDAYDRVFRRPLGEL